MNWKAGSVCTRLHASKMCDCVQDCLSLTPVPQLLWTGRKVMCAVCLHWLIVDCTLMSSIFTANLKLVQEWYNHARMLCFVYTILVYDNLLFLQPYYKNALHPYPGSGSHLGNCPNWWSFWSYTKPYTPKVPHVVLTANLLSSMKYTDLV